MRLEGRTRSEEKKIDDFQRLSINSHLTRCCRSQNSMAVSSIHKHWFRVLRWGWLGREGIQKSTYIEVRT